MSGYCYRWEHKYNQHNIYVGSTEDNIKREREHRGECHNPNSDEYNKPFYKHVRKYGSIEDWTMTIIYEGPNFRLFEKNYIKATWQYNLNDNIPLPTEQEKKDRQKAYYKANRDKINEKAKTYHKANRDKRNAKGKERYQLNKDKIKEKNHLNKDKLNEKSREYYEVNRDYELARQKAYNKANRDKINERKREKITCDNCGVIVSKGALFAHKKRKICIESTQNIHLKISEIK